ncbi:hypothetical protein BT96DRAFT_1007806 [Gymnopus androsaceus JB14]|uniref:Uncharacterized protein n=1 Tax=Gymnopus androsaceus JB14 TaxID=1447944 RepID=A0A6A4GH68_9AGAR|nr:hypothetical protein BT96DRAFT_1007806 [Gymnopus androsaceus JB14]
MQSITLTVIIHAHPHLQTIQPLSNKKLYDSLRRRVPKKHSLQVLESFLRASRGEPTLYAACPTFLSLYLELTPCSSTTQSPTMLTDSKLFVPPRPSPRLLLSSSDVISSTSVCVFPDTPATKDEEGRTNINSVSDKGFLEKASEKSFASLFTDSVKF